MRFQFLMLVFLTTLASSHAKAAGIGGSGFVGMAGLTMGAGSSGNKSTSIEKRDMLYSEAALSFGYSLGMVAPILQASYRYVGQRTDPSQVSDTNMGGTGYLAGGGLLIDFSSISFLLIYDMAGNFDLSQKSGSSKVSYTTPKGYHVNILYHWRMPWDIVLTYSSVDYQKKKVDAVETDIASDVVNQTLYGLGLSYRF